MPPKTTVNVEYYVLVLKILRQHISRKHHELERNWVLHYGNLRLHIATTVEQYLSKCSIKIMPDPPCNPDLTQCNFCLFRMFKKKLHCRKFNIDSEVISGIFETVSRIMLLYCFEKWVKR